MNICVLQGHLTRPAQRVLLKSGDELVNLELSMPGPDGALESVRVVWPNAPATASSLDVDDRVLVVGRVRRRFFQSGGTTGSRTEVIATSVVPRRQAKRAHSALADAVAQIEKTGVLA